MDTKAKFAELRADMYRDLGTRVTTKATDVRFWKVLDTLLRIVSFGKLNNFMKRTTTIGRWIAFGEDVDLYNTGMRELLVLVHEREHVIRFRKYTLLGMAFLYLFFPLPIGLAYFRYKFELEAFLKEADYAKDLGVTINPEDIIKSLSGSSYVWAWPEKWVRKAMMAKR